MHGFVTTNRMRDSKRQRKRFRKLADRSRSDSIAGASSGGNDFVPDAVEGVADRDLGPEVVLGGGGGEDVVEEVWC
jgi:hypothetical protein